MRIWITAALIVLAVMLAAGLLLARPPQDKAAQGVAVTPVEEAGTMVSAYGLERSQIASFDGQLCARLIRFGRVAQHRGRHRQAKRFFWQALLVDPTSKLAWRLYDQAVLRGLAEQVERLPGVVGLEGMTGQDPGLPEAEPEHVEEGC